MSRKTHFEGGLVVTPAGAEQLDILIDGEQIVRVGHGLQDDALDAQRVDARGLAILPGLIDVHVHLREPGGEHKEDFLSGTRAALAGGVTTVFAMPNTSPPITGRATFEDAWQRAAEKAVCDWALYLGATPDNAAEVAALADRAAGLKMYIGSSTGSLLVDAFAAQLAHFETFPAERIIAVHAEDEAAVQYYAAHGERRPPICAALATSHALELARHTGRRLHIAHASTPREMALIQQARADGVRVTCEVSPHHLFLTTEDEAELGTLGRVNPPLRAPEEVDGLWAQRDVIDMVATDHAPHTLEEKASDSPPSGMPGLETTLPLLLTAAHDGRITLEDVVRWTATRPAEVFGIPNKGRIEPGFDADLVLVDLDAAWTLPENGWQTRCGWSPFAGRQVRGRAVEVYRRGERVVAGGEVLAEAGSGRAVFG